MRAFRFERPLMGRLALFAAFAAAGALAMPGLVGLQRAVAESGPLEGGQELLLLVTFGFYAWAGLRQRSVGRMASFGAAALAGVFFLRELELPVSGSIGAYMNSATFRWHEAAILAATAGPYILIRRHLVSRIVCHFRSRHVGPYVLVLAFLLLGDRLDGNRLWDSQLSTFFEELSETLAYVVFAATGVHVAQSQPPSAGLRS